SSSIPLRAPVQDQAKRHSDSRGDESEATPGVLDRARVTLLRVRTEQTRCSMEKFEYFSGTPEVGIVPRAPHAGPLLQHLYEPEHGRGGFAGTVTHTYHLYPPNNWLPDETRVLPGWAPLWES